MSAKQRLLTALIVLGLPWAASALERTDLLPPAAQTYMRISNTTTFWSNLKQSSVGRLWVDPQFQDFLGNPDVDTWKELFLDGEPDAEDEMLIEQLKMLKGEVILAFDMEEDAPYIIAAMNKDDFLRSLDMDAKLKDLSDEPFEISKSTFQDEEIIRHISDGGTPDEESSWQTHLNGTFVLGYSKEWVEKCIVQLKKDAPTEPTGFPVFSLNLPLSKLIHDEILVGMQEEAAESQTPSIYDPERLLDAMGLMGIESYSLKIELRESEMIVDSNLRVSDLTKGLFTLLDLQPSELPTVTFIPDDIASLEVGRFNLLRFWQEIPTVLTAAMPTAKPQFDMMIAMLQQQMGINLEQDLLVNLDTKYVAFSVTEDAQQISVIAVGLKDATAFKTGLETAIAAPALQAQVATGLEIGEFLDHTLYTINDADPDTAMAFGVAGDYLLYGHPDGLRQVIRSETSEDAANTSFEQSTLVKGLRQHVPPRAFSYSAIDWKKNMDAIVRELSKPEYTTLIQQSWAKSGSALPPPDFGKLPATEHIASFFNVSYQYAEATSDGLHQQIILKY